MNFTKVTKYLPLAGAMGLVTLLWGCMHNPNSSADFGEAADHMARAQTYDPGAATVPPREAMRPVDGDVVESTVEGYRQSAVPAGDSIENEIHINVGN